MANLCGKKLHGTPWTELFIDQLGGGAFLNN